MDDAKYQNYLRWLEAREAPSAEVIAGLRLARPIRLDAEGLRAEGWGADMPDDWGVTEGAPLRIGGYDEDRGIYDSEVFAGDGGERRTVHLGIDIFAPEDTPVHAPIHGRVHSFQDNDNLKDYGPTLILEHMPAPDLVFWTLYGHLNRDSLEDLYVGKAFAQGDVIAALGSREVNGGWAPHLHFQIILDIGDHIGDFPGVFTKTTREAAKLICPDPRPLLGLI